MNSKEELAIRLKEEAKKVWDGRVKAKKAKHELNRILTKRRRLEINQQKRLVKEAKERLG